MPGARSETSGKLVAAADNILELSPNLLVGTGNTGALDVRGTPRLFFWVNRNTAAGTLSITPQFAVTDTASAGVISPKWHNLSAPVAVAYGTPTLLNFTIAAKFIRIVFTVAGAVQDTEVVFGGHQ